MSQNYPVMGESAGKPRKRYVDCPSSESKICLIHGPGYCSDECKVMGDFGAKCTNGKPTKDCGNNPSPRKIFNRQQENNAIVSIVVDEILLNESQKVGAARESPKFWYSDYHENDIYQIEWMSIEDTKEKVE